MDIDENLFDDLIKVDNYKPIYSFLDRLDFLLTDKIGLQRTDEETSDLLRFLEEVKNFCHNNVSLYFDKTLRDLKCVITDENIMEHVIWVKYMGPRNLRIVDMNLPRSHIHDQIYRSINEVISVVTKHLGALSNYFSELSEIDKYCIVMEPVRPTFKEDYRKIQLVEKIWLHVEVSPDGSAKNFRILGQFDQQELQEFLQDWDHDKSIATNILKIISSLECNVRQEINQAVVPECGICYCVELPGDNKVPQPLCNNSKCGVYFHRSCLYEWLITCPGARTSPFGFGKCPSCFQYIQCSDRDV